MWEPVVSLELAAAAAAVLSSFFLAGSAVPCKAAEVAAVEVAAAAGSVAPKHVPEAS